MLTPDAALLMCTLAALPQPCSQRVSSGSGTFELFELLSLL